MPSFTAAPKSLLLDCAKIRPNPMQPRRRFDPDEIAGLAQSIAQNGLLQPVSVRKAGGEYQLVAGERRLRAAIQAGLTKIPCLLIAPDDTASESLALIENIQRSDLNCFEEAAAMASLLQKSGLTQLQLAQRLGKSQAAVANKLRLLALEPALRDRMAEAGLTERHARALLTVPDALRAEAVERIIAAGMNVAQTERYLASLSAENAAKPRKIRGALRDLRLFDNSLSKAAASLRCCGITSVINRKTVPEGVEYTVLLQIPK